MGSLLLVRHGQASFGAEHYDVLSATGRAQAERVAQAIGARGPRPARIVSGGLRRQIDTAAPLATATGLDVEIDERWNEYDAGDILTCHSSSPARAERTTGDEPVVSARDFQAVLDRALADWIAAGGRSPTGEPFPAFAARADGALRDAAAATPRGGTTVVVTSGGVIGAVCNALLGGEPRRMIALNRVAINAALSKVIVGRTGMTLVSFNEHGHLEAARDGLVTYR